MLWSIFWISSVFGPVFWLRVCATLLNCVACNGTCNASKQLKYFRTSWLSPPWIVFLNVAWYPPWFLAFGFVLIGPCMCNMADFHVVCNRIATSLCCWVISCVHSHDPSWYVVLLRSSSGLPSCFSRAGICATRLIVCCMQLSCNSSGLLMTSCFHSQWIQRVSSP